MHSIHTSLNRLYSTSQSVQATSPPLLALEAHVLTQGMWPAYSDNSELVLPSEVVRTLEVYEYGVLGRLFNFIFEC